MSLSIKKEKDLGIALTSDEITELSLMYYSGNYHLKEMSEWFGVSVYKIKQYLKKVEK